jgi:serine/threonine protein kinase
VTSPLNWLAPEIIRGEKSNTRCDVWSFCMLIIEMLSGETPYGDSLPDFSVARALATFTLPLLPPPERLSFALEETLYDILVENDLRPSIDDVIARLSHTELHIKLSSRPQSKHADSEDPKHVQSDLTKHILNW